jgi:hypothetical protein
MLILRRDIDDTREELSFLTQIHRAPRVGRSKKIQNPLEAIASRRRLNVLRNDR